MPFGLHARLPFWGFPSRSFTFFNAGRLVDGDLELISPSLEWIDAYLASCRHPMTLEQAVALSDVTRRQLIDFIDLCPAGRQAADTAGASVPTYHFWMRDLNTSDFPIGGAIALRIGNTYDTVMYYGHFGYHVYPHARGRHFAERACRLLLPLAAQHGIQPVWITCNPDNQASRRTCERLGAKLVETIPVPVEHALYQRGELQKCRFRVDLAG